MKGEEYGIWMAIKLKSLQHLNRSIIIYSQLKKRFVQRTEFIFSEEIMIKFRKLSKEVNYNAKI